MQQCDFLGARDRRGKASLAHLLGDGWCIQPTIARQEVADSDRPCTLGLEPWRSNARPGGYSLLAKTPWCCGFIPVAMLEPFTSVVEM
jgi:hypothetical protein